MTIQTKYSIGDVVFLKTDIDQRQRIIRQITIRPSGIEYNLAFGTEESWHFELEIAKEKDVLKYLNA